MNKDQIKGRAKEAAGKVKEVTGKAVGSKRLEGKGMAEKTLGKFQKNMGDARNQARKAH